MSPAIIYFYLNKKDIETSYGDAKRGYIFRGVRNGLRVLEGTKAHPKNWRPVLVTLCRDLVKDKHVIEVGSWIESERGLHTVVNIEERGDDTFEGRLALRGEHEDKLREILQEEKLSVKNFIIESIYQNPGN